MSFLQEINLKLDVFEGPLDLLLHLIQKLEIDIYDIPITAVTEQYMSYIHAMQTLELEVAGEYLVMAATLMAIKSQMLLPKQELEIIDDENFFEEEDPREALVARYWSIGNLNMQRLFYMKKKKNVNSIIQKNQWIWMIIKRKIQHYRLIKSIQLIYF